MTKRIHGYLKSGEPLTDELIEVFEREAENGFSEEMIITARGGRPRLGGRQEVR